MRRTDKYFNIANILVAAAGVATGTGSVAIAAAGMTAVDSLIKIARSWPRNTDTIIWKVSAQLKRSLSDMHLSDEQRLLILQMIEQVDPTPNAIIACARDADCLTERLLDSLQADPAHSTIAAQDGFRQVVSPILRQLLLDPDICDALRPIHEQAVAHGLAVIQAKQEEQTTVQKTQTDQLSRIEEMIAVALGYIDTTPDALAALQAIGNSLPNLPGIVERYQAALARGDEAHARQTLESALADATAHRMKTAEAKEVADRQYVDAADAEARLTEIDAEHKWKGKDRIGAIHRLGHALSIAASTALRGELATLRQRRFNIVLHAQRGYPDVRDLMRLPDMPAPDVVTYSILMAKAPDFTGAEGVRAEMVAAGIKPNEVTFNTLVAKAPDFTGAEAVRAEMVAAGIKPNEFTFSTLIAKAPDSARAAAVLPEMLAAGIKPNEVTFNTLIAKAPDFTGAEAVRAEMVAAGIKPNEVTFNALVAKAPDFARAEAVRAEMVAAGIKPNEFTFNTLIAKAPDFARAEAVRAEMVAAGIKPNEFTFSTLIAKAPDFTRAEAVRAEMVAAGIKPNEVTFNILISRAPTQLVAMRLFRDMLKANVKPNKQLATSLMKSVPKITDALKIAQDFRRTGGQMDVKMFGCLLFKSKEFRYLEPIFYKMLEKGPKPDRMIWQHVIIHAPDKSTRLKLIREMRSEGLEPDAIMWRRLSSYGIYAEDFD